MEQPLSGGGMAMVQVEPNTLMGTDGNPFTGVLSITEVPVDLTPAALPPEVSPSAVVTIQPGEMQFQRPSSLSLPNRSGLAAGTELELWSINHLTGDFDVVGTGRVTSDGSMIETIEGGVRSSSWHFFIPPRENVPSDPNDNDNTPDEGCLQCRASAAANSEVVLHSGEYIEDHQLATYQSLGETRGVSLTYRSIRADPRQIVHFGYGSVRQNRIFARLQMTVAGIGVPLNSDSEFGLGPTEGHFWRVQGQDAHAALQVDLSDLPSGRHTYRLDYGTGAFAMFPAPTADDPLAANDSFSGRTRRFEGEFISVNLTSSPFGAGWTMDGLLQAAETVDGSVVLFDGQDERLFRPGLPGEYFSPPGDYSTLVKRSDGTFQLSEVDGTLIRFGANNAITSLLDRSGNETRYEYGDDGLLDRIIDPVGLVTNFESIGGQITSITGPAGRRTELYFDEFGNLLQITDPDQSVRTFEYDHRHLLIAEVNKRGLRETQQYGFHGRIESVVRRDGQTMTFEPAQVLGLYPPSQTSDAINPPIAIGRTDAVTRYTDARGDEITVRLDAAGQERFSSDDTGPQETILRTSQNEVSAVIDARGNRTEYSYDDRGNLLSVTDAVSRDRTITLGSISSPGETDSFQFLVPEDTVLLFDPLLRPPTALSPRNLEWSLEGPEGDLFDEEFFSVSSHQVIPASAGRYTLTIDGGLDVVGDYAFRLQQLNSAATLDLAIPQVNARSLEYDETHLYQFSAEAGDRFFFERTTGAPDITLVDPNGILVDLERTAAPTTGRFTDPLTLEGTYTALVRGAISGYEFTTHRIAEREPLALELNETTEVDFDAPGESQVYTFTLDEPDTLYFDSLTNDSNFEVTLAGPWGAMFEDAGLGDDPRRMPVSFAPAGDYTLTVVPTRGITGSAEFVLKSSSSAVATSSGEVINADLIPGNETDLYRVSFAAGADVTLRVIDSEASGARWRLLSPQGQTVFDQEFATTDTINLPIAGEYTLLVEGRQSEGARRPNYSFQVDQVGSTPPPSPPETSIDIGAPVSGSLASASQVDEFALTIDQPTSLFLDALQDSRRVRLSIQTPLGDLYNSTLDDDATSDELFLRPGQYVVSVTGDLDDYGFQFVDLDSIPTISRGEVIDVSFAAGRRSQNFAFMAEQGEPFFIDYVTAENLISSSVMRVLGPSGQLLERSRDLGSRSSFGTLTTEEAGQHTIVIESNDDDADGTLQFSLHEIATPIATPISIGDVVEGSIDAPGASDVFEFSLSQSTTLSFDSLVLDSSNVLWELSGPRGVENRLIFFGSQIEPLPLIPGDYRLRVSQRTDNVGEYAFRLLELGAGQPINVGESVSGGSSTPAESTLYQIDLSAGQRVYFDSRLDPSKVDANAVPERWALIDPSGQEIFDISMPERSGTALDTGDTQVIVPRDGSYTLLIGGTSRDPGEEVAYEFTIQEITDDAPVDISFNEVINGSIDSPGQTDTFTFGVSEPTNYYIDTLSARNPDSVFRFFLNGPTGEDVFSSIIPDHQSSGLPSTLLPGQYTLSLTDQNDGLGPYSFRLLRSSNAPMMTLGERVTGNLAAGETLAFRVEAQAGDQLSFDYLPADPVGFATWHFEDPWGQPLFRTSSTLDQLTDPLEYGGTYTLFLIGRDEPVTYDFRVSVAANEAPDLGGTAINLNEDVAFTLAEDEQRAFTFSVDQTTTLRFDSRGDSGLVHRVFGAAGRFAAFSGGTVRLDSIHGNAGVDNFIALPGQYTILAEGVIGRAGNYVFRLQDYAAAEPFEIGESISGQLPSREHATIYRFSATAGSEILIDDQSSPVPLYDLRDTHGLRIDSGVCDCQTSIPRDGEYFLIVEGRNSGSTSTEIPFQFVVRGVTANAAQSIEFAERGIQEFRYETTFNQLTSFVDERGNRTLYEVNPENGNTLSVRRVVGGIDPEGLDGDDVVTRLEYTPSGLIAQSTDPLGRVTENEYDAFGRLIATVFAAGTSDEASIQFEYDAAGNRTADINENGGRAEYAYDAMNRLVRITAADPDGGGPLQSPVTLFEYDASGNLIRQTDARNSITETFYDSMDRVSRVVSPNEAEVSRTYDGDGNVLSVVDALGNTTNNTYDARNRLSLTIDPDGGETRFEYDGDNNLSALVDPVGNRTEYEYDARNRLIREVDPAGEETTYEYDQVGNLIRKTDRNARVTRFDYDALDRLTRESWLHENVTIVNQVHYAYDKVGNLLSSRDIFSGTERRYDDRNRLLTESNSGTPGAPEVLLTYTYDAVGNVTDVTDTVNGLAGPTTTTTYDALNRPVRLVQSGSTVSNKQVELAYNSIGQSSRVDRFAGGQLVATTNLSYDGLNRLVDLRHGGPPGEFAFYEYGYDASNRITSINDIDGSSEFGYDATNQLASVDRGEADLRGDEAYQFDANGNRTFSHRHDDEYLTGAANRLSSDGDFDYTYDPEGNPLTRIHTVTGERREFEWDHRNRLLAVVDFDASGVETQRVEFTYDVAGRRISKSVDTPAADEVITHFAYDREDVLLDFVQESGGTRVDQRYFHGPGIDEVFAQESGSGEVLWLTTDHLGTVRDVIDNSGQVVQHLQYDSFGNVVDSGGVEPLTRFLYTSREFDTEIGLQFNRARYYDATVGSFLNEDPIGFAAEDSNLFRYAGNSTLSLYDPFGTTAIAPILSIPGLVGAGTSALVGCGIQQSTGLPQNVSNGIAGALVGGFSAANGLAICVGPHSLACGLTVIGLGVTIGGINGFGLPALDCPPPDSCDSPTPPPQPGPTPGPSPSGPTRGPNIRVPPPTRITN
ncbi:MAG: RHS repeat-associated core domain-containing protein [Planctomycetota bacterium]